MTGYAYSSFDSKGLFRKKRKIVKCLYIKYLHKLKVVFFVFHYINVILEIYIKSYYLNKNILIWIKTYWFHTHYRVCVIYIVEDTEKYRTAIKAQYFYIDMCLSVMLDSLSCLFTLVSFLTISNLVHMMLIWNKLLQENSNSKYEICILCEYSSSWLVLLFNPVGSPSIPACH